MSDLFSKPPFDINAEIIERNKQLAEKYPESADDYNAQTERILSGKTDFNPLRDKYNAASPADQLRMMGVKSGKAGKVYTVAEDKAKRLSAHAESNLQLLCLKWVKKWFPEDRTIIHKREGKRHGFNRAVLSTLNNNSDGYPDHEFNCSTQGLLYIEFKRPGEDWLLKDGKTVKTAYRHQYRMHLQLWKENKPVYFCNDFDKFRELYKAFKSGNKLPQQIYICP